MFDAVHCGTGSIFRVEEYAREYGQGKVYGWEKKDISHEVNQWETLESREGQVETTRKEGKKN